MNGKQFLELVSLGDIDNIDNALKTYRFKKSTLNKALFISIENESIELCNLLLKYGANINSKDEEGNTPIIKAAEFNNNDMVKFLIKNDADINLKNDEGEIALIQAVENDNVDMVKILLEEDLKTGDGSNLNIIYHEGKYSPLLMAGHNKNKDIIKLLLEFGADPDLQNSEGNTVLHVMLKINPDKQDQIIEIINILFEYGINPNIKNNNGNTPIVDMVMINQHKTYYTSQKIVLNLVQLLIENDADPYIKNNDGKNILNFLEDFPAIFYYIFAKKLGKRPTTFVDFHNTSKAKDLYLDCHGTKIIGDYFKLPDNITLITFSAEFEFGYTTHTTIFRAMVGKYGKTDFINKFKQVLYTFGTALIDMNEVELVEECQLRGIKLGNKTTSENDMAFGILSTIWNAGRSNSKQRIMYHSPGSIYNNYKLSAGNGIHDIYEIICDKVKLDISLDTRNSDHFTGGLIFDNWIGKTNSNFYNIRDKYFYRFGISDITKGNQFLLNQELLDIQSQIYDSYTTLKDVINILKTHPVNYTLFVQHCKTESGEKRTQQQRQKKQLPTIGLLQGIGLQLAFKSPKKVNKNSPKKVSRKSIRKVNKNSSRKSIRKVNKKN